MVSACVISGGLWGKHLSHLGSDCWLSFGTCWLRIHNQIGNQITLLNWIKQLLLSERDSAHSFAWGVGLQSALSSLTCWVISQWFFWTAEFEEIHYHICIQGWLSLAMQWFQISSIKSESYSCLCSTLLNLKAHSLICLSHANAEACQYLKHWSIWNP